MALAQFECSITVEYVRPECGHVISIECHTKKSLDMKKASVRLKECNEIVSDYIHPMCNHRIARPKCAAKRRWEEKPPECTESVVHRRPCGCRKKMACSESMKEQDTPVMCTESLQVERPRCGHILSMRCYQAVKLKEDWLKQCGRSAENISNNSIYKILTYFRNKIVKVFK